MTHIMLDLETWGRTPGSDIRSIGAVVFDPVAPGGWSASDHTLMNGETFYIATGNTTIVDHYAQTKDDKLIAVKVKKYPLTCDPETVQWWNEQAPEAQAAFANPVDLREACLQFAIWLESVNSAKPVPRYPDEVNGPEIRIWANDPHFDVSILDAVFRAVDLPVPWHYRSPRSMKTIVEAAGMTSDDYCNYGTAHNALDDAIAQAMTVCEAYKRLGLRK